MNKSQQEEPNAKSLNIASCIYVEDWWNDPEQRNYILYECRNPENVGGERGDPFSDNPHGLRTYSCWHKNESMTYRCWSDSKKIAQCPIAIAKTEPEVSCERFKKGEAHPSVALITKKGLREKFHQPDALCLTCENCIK